MVIMINISRFTFLNHPRLFILFVIYIVVFLDSVGYITWIRCTRKPQNITSIRTFKQTKKTIGRVLAILALHKANASLYIVRMGCTQLTQVTNHSIDQSCKGKQQYLLTWKVGRYCCLPLLDAPVPGVYTYQALDAIIYHPLSYCLDRVRGTEYPHASCGDTCPCLSER